jgi:tetratricopeptide (TPR) repeat protein
MAKKSLAPVLVATLSLGASAARNADAPVTFARDIAPIVHRSCTPCHRPGGAGPFDLVTFDDVRRRAATIVRVTSTGYMPPWKPAGHDFLGERRLSTSEIRAFERWNASGLREGDTSALVQPRFPSTWQAGEPDMVVALPEYALRADGPDVFRNFVVAGPGRGPLFVRGLEFCPGSRAVHHANIRVDPTPASRRLDEADPEPGYEGAILRSADYPDGHFLGWTPGQAPPLPAADMAWRLEPASDFVVQLHLRPTGKPERIAPAIALYFTNEPPSRTPAIVRLGRQNIDIAAGAVARVVDSFTLPVAVDVRAIQPHAHYRARSVEVWARPPGAPRRALLEIANWDFNWQDQYRYRVPVSLPAGTSLEMQYLFDNSSTNPRNPDRPPRAVSWGWRSSDEMADVWVQVMTHSDDDRARLATVARRKMAAEDAIGCEVLIARQPDYVALRNDAAALYLELGQPARALPHFEVVQRLEPESALALYNVGVALEGTGRTGEAARRYEQALHLDPHYSAAYNNLGNVRLGEGNLAEARRAYERAVEFGSANAEAHNNLGAVVLASGNAAEAVRLLEDAIHLRSDYPEAHFNLARALAAQGRTDDAQKEAALAERQAAVAGKTELVAAIRSQFRR